MLFHFYFFMKNLQKATVQDIPLIQSLARTSWESAYSGIISAEQIDFMLDQMYSASELEKHFQNPNYHYFLIIFNKNPVGFMGFEHHYEPEITKLHRIYLVPAAKGHGLGKMAIDFLKNEVIKSNDRRIILNVNKINNAKKIYESQGFRVYDEVVLQIGGGYVMDDYLMEFRL